MVSHGHARRESRGHSGSMGSKGLGFRGLKSRIGFLVSCVKV